MSQARGQVSKAQWIRRLAVRRRERVGFVLSGGGPLGAMQVGALKAFERHAIKPDLIVGTSVGAINGAFLAFSPPESRIERLEDAWNTMRESELFPATRWRPGWARFLARGDHVYSNGGLRALLEMHFPNARFEQAITPLGVVATDLDTGLERVFTEGPVIDPLLASGAMPGVFPPISIEGKLYIDGGVADNVPIAPAVSLGATTIYVIDTTGASVRSRRPLVRPIDYLLHAFSLARSQRVALERTLYSERVRVVHVPVPELDTYIPFASLGSTRALIDSTFELVDNFLASGPADAIEASAPGA
ncbi:MAG TPA: patatin-like phospholipase family protein [Actinomycetota bacterium]|nr:patatin-like phospholipase family protein [Actinomycetota bacterium]